MNEVRLSPYINFQGRAREAMEFYHGILGGNLRLIAVDDQGTAHPAGPDERIQFAVLVAGETALLATDGHPSYPATVGEHMAVTLSGREKEPLETLARALAEGGVLKQPLTPQPWGGETAWLTDRFGINWMVRLAQA